MEVWLCPGDVYESDEEDWHLYGSTADDIPDETLEGDSLAPQRRPIPGYRLVAQSGIDCIDSGLGNMVCDDEWISGTPKDGVDCAHL